MKRSFLILALTTLVVVIAAWISVVKRSPETEVEKAPLFPELAAKINDINKVIIRDNEESTILVATENNQESPWVLENRGGYPAYFNRIKPLILALSELEIREAKTANPDMFSRLEVEDVTVEKAKSRQIELLDKGGEVIVSLIVGKDRINRTDGSVDSLYVRRTGEEQSYLVKGQVDVSASPEDWWNNEIINLSSERLQSILIEHSSAPAQTIKASRNDKDTENYQLINIPDGFKIQSQTVIDSLARLVEDLNFDNVDSSVDFNWPEATTTSSYETFDGLILKVKSAEVEGKVWSEFSFDYTALAGQENVNESEGQPRNEESDKLSVEDEVKNLNDKTRGWVYVLPSFKVKMLRRQQQDLLVAADEKKERQADSSQDSVLNPGPGSGLDQGFGSPSFNESLLKGLPQ